MQALQECVDFAPPMESKNQAMLLKLQTNAILYFIYKFVERQSALSASYQVLPGETLKKLKMVLLYRKGLFDETQSLVELSTSHGELVTLGKLWIQCSKDQNYKNLNNDFFYQKLLAHGAQVTTTKASDRVSETDPITYLLAMNMQKLFIQNCSLTLPPRVVIGAERMLATIAPIYIPEDFSEPEQELEHKSEQSPERTLGTTKRFS